MKLMQSWTRQRRGILIKVMLRLKGGPEKTPSLLGVPLDKDLFLLPDEGREKVTKPYPLGILEIMGEKEDLIFKRGEPIIEAKVALQ